MHPSVSHSKAALPHLTVMGILAFMCCLMCTPSSARAEIMPPPLYLWEIPTEAEAEPETPSTLTRLTSHLLRPSLGQGQSGAALENNSQRKKKKKASINNARNMVFLAWLAEFCTPPCSVIEAFAPPVVREDVPCLPSWRGFVFFPMPPPLIS